MVPRMTSAKAGADQSASSQEKLNAWSSSSGRTYAAIEGPSGTQASATAIRSGPYSSRISAQRR